MKFALVLLAIVATSTAKWTIPNIGTGELAKELQDFLDLMPEDEIKAITLQYFAQDAEFQKMVQYFKDEDFKLLVKECQELPEAKELLDYMNNAGVDSYKLLNMLNNWIGIVPSTNLAANKQITGGIRGYIDDMKAILPINEITAMHKDKMQNNPVYSNFVNKLQSETFQKLVNQVYCHPKFQELLENAKNVGIDLLRVKDLLEVILGIVVPRDPVTCTF